MGNHPDPHDPDPHAFLAVADRDAVDDLDVARGSANVEARGARLLTGAPAQLELHSAAVLGIRSRTAGRSSRRRNRS